MKLVSSLLDECNTASVGCSRNATHLNNKTASGVFSTVLRYVAAYQRAKRQRSYHMSRKTLNLLIITLLISMFAEHNQIEAATLSSERALKFKLQNNKWHQSFFKEMCSKEISWKNSCRGQWISDEKNFELTASKSQSIPHYQALRILKNAISTTYNELRSNTTLISISDTNGKWSKHKRSYKFLPRLKRYSTLSLRTWHRQIQTYAAGFTYLRRAQLYYDYKSHDEETSMSKILKKFEQAALHILCEIETTINITSAHRKRTLKTTKLDKMRHILRFQTISINFYTRSENCIEALIRPDKEMPVINEIDLKYAKFRFLSYLRLMRKMVREKTKTVSNISRSHISNSINHSKLNNSVLNSLSRKINSRSHDSRKINFYSQQ